MKFSKALENIYAYEHDPAFFIFPEITDAEYRVIQLHYYLEKGIKPWEWDYENYSDDKQDMYGRFYPEDLANLDQLQHYINLREERIQRKLKHQRQAAAARR